MFRAWAYQGLSKDLVRYIRWHEYIGDHYVEISVEEILAKNDQISIKDKGRYTIDDEITQINIEWLIDE